jgi:hypothetical protein
VSPSRRTRKERLEQAGELLALRAKTSAEEGGYPGGVFVGTTSQPSRYPQPGVRQTELTTGVELRHGRSWLKAVSVQHLCYPPERYPDGLGPGSRWQDSCGAQWEAHGILVHEHPVGTATRPRGALLGPLWWSWVPGTGTDDPENYLEQQMFWNWRHPLDLIYAFLVEGRRD